MAYDLARLDLELGKKSKEKKEIIETKKQEMINQKKAWERYKEYDDALEEALSLKKNIKPSEFPEVKEKFGPPIPEIPSEKQNLEDALQESFEKPTERKEISAKEPSESSTKTGKIEPSVEKIPKEQIINPEVKTKDLLETLKTEFENEINGIGEGAYIDFSAMVNEYLLKADKLPEDQKETFLKILKERFDARKSDFFSAPDKNWDVKQELQKVEDKLNRKLIKIDPLLQQLDDQYKEIDPNKEIDPKNFSTRFDQLLNWQITLKSLGYETKKDEREIFNQKITKSYGQLEQNIRDLIGQIEKEPLQQNNLENLNTMLPEVQKRKDAIENNTFGIGDKVLKQETRKQLNNMFLNVDSLIPEDQLQNIEEFLIFKNSKITSDQARALKELVSVIDPDSISSDPAKKAQSIAGNLVDIIDPQIKKTYWEKGLLTGTLDLIGYGQEIKNVAQAYTWNAISNAAKWGAPYALDFLWRNLLESKIEKNIVKIYSDLPEKYQQTMRVILTEAEKFAQDPEQPLANLKEFIVKAKEATPAAMGKIISSAKFTKDNAQSLRILLSGAKEIGLSRLFDNVDNYIELMKQLEKTGDITKTIAQDIKKQVASIDVNKFNETLDNVMSIISQASKKIAPALARVNEKLIEKISPEKKEELAEQIANVIGVVTESIKELESGTIPESVTYKEGIGKFKSVVTFFKKASQKFSSLMTSMRRKFVDLETDYKRTHNQLRSVLDIKDENIDQEIGVKKLQEALNDPKKAIKVRTYINKQANYIKELIREKGRVKEAISTFYQSGRVAIAYADEIILEDLSLSDENIQALNDIFDKRQKYIKSLDTTMSELSEQLKRIEKIADPLWYFVAKDDYDDFATIFQNLLKDNQLDFANNYLANLKKSYKKLELK